MPPPTSFLYFTSAMSGSTPVVSQSIMKAIVPVGASTVACELRYAGLAPGRVRLVPHRRAPPTSSSSGTNAESSLCVQAAVLGDHAEHRSRFVVVAGERPELTGDARRLQVGLAAHQRGDRAGVLAAGLGVVRQAERHQQRAEVGVAEPELAVGLARCAPIGSVG